MSPLFGSIKNSLIALLVLMTVKPVIQDWLVEPLKRNLFHGVIIVNAHSNLDSSIPQAIKLLGKKGYTIFGAVCTYAHSSSIITEDTEPELKAGEMCKKAVKAVFRITLAQMFPPGIFRESIELRAFGTDRKVRADSGEWLQRNSLKL